MKKSIKRILSLLLVAILIAGSLPVINYAETEAEYKYNGNVTAGFTIKTSNASGTNKNAFTTLMSVSPVNDTSTIIYAYCVDWENGLSENEKFSTDDLESLSYIISASKIRAILNGGYPTLSASDLMSAVNETLLDGEKLTSLSDKEAVTATQAAVWKYSNNVSVNLADSNGMDSNQKTRVQKVYNYLISLDAVSAPSTPEIQTTTPTVSIENDNLIIQFKYKNVLPNPAIQLSLAAFSMAQADVDDGWRQVTFTKSMLNVNRNDFSNFVIQIDGYNNVFDTFAFDPINGRASTQTLVSLGLTKKRPTDVTLNGSTMPLLASLTVNKSFSNQSIDEVQFQLYSGDVKVAEGTTANQTYTFINIIPGTYKLKELTPDRYTSSLGDGLEVTLSAGDSETINVTNTAERKTTLTVKHLDTNGTPKADDETFEGYADETYSISAKTFENFHVEERPSAETGNFGELDFTLTYVYKEDPKSKVTVLYVDEDDNALSDYEEIINYVGKAYITTALTIPNYHLSATPTNATGNHGESDIVVKYVYVENDKSSVTVNYVDENDVSVATSETLTGYVGDDYVSEAKDVLHYTLKTTPDNASGTFGENPITVTYVYKQDPKNTITVRYVVADGDGYMEIERPSILTGFADEPYSTSPKTVTNYKLLTTPDNASGTFGSEPFEVVYIYEANDQIMITVLYQDEDGSEIADPDYVYGYPEQTYSTSAKGIGGYSLLSTPENASGTFGEEGHTVIYVYEKDQVSTDDDEEEEEPETPQPPAPQPPTEPQGPQGTVTINYESTDGASLAPSFAFTGTVGSNYVSTPRNFEGFELVEMPANASGSFTESGVSVTYVYSDGTEIIEEEDTALSAPEEIDLSVSTSEEPTTEEVVELVDLDEEIPLAEALPKTGQASPELFYGIGGLISAVGIFLKKRK